VPAAEEPAAEEPAPGKLIFEITCFI
jgi:hypothetical protein